MTDRWNNITFTVSMKNKMRLMRGVPKGATDDAVAEIFDGVDTEWEQLYNSISEKFDGIAISYTSSPLNYTISTKLIVKASKTYDVKYSHGDMDEVQDYIIRDIKDNLERNIGLNTDTYEVLERPLELDIHAKIEKSEPRSSSSRRSSSSKRSRNKSRSKSKSKSKSKSSRKLEHIFSPRPSSSSSRRRH